MAGENIDLGSFNWDITAIEKQILENKKNTQAYSEVLKLNKDVMKAQSKEIQETAKVIAVATVAQKELNKQSAETAKVIVKATETQKQLNDQVRAGTISQAQYDVAIAEVDATLTDATEAQATLTAATEENNKTLEEAKTRSSEVVAVQTELIQSNIELEASIKTLREENKSLTTLMEAGREEAVDNATAYKDLNKELNALKLESKNLGAQLVILERSGDTTSEAYLALKEQWEAVSEEANKLNESFKAIDAAVGDNQRSVGDYTESIKKAFGGIDEGFSSFMSGDFQGGLDSFKTSFKGLKDTATDFFKTLAANPWLLLVAGIVYYVKEVIAHNEAIAEANKQVENLAHSTGQLTDELRRAGTAISETFETKSFEDAIVEMDTLMDSFGVSSKEAWDIYLTGLARGGAANGEFGDSIKEYGSLFAKNGYSAKQFIDILNSGINLGIYSDKLPDAIKEAGLSLNEQTKSTRDALINAFGAPFSDAILVKVQKGQLTVAQALDEISKKAQTANLNQQQLAQLTADLFKGAGEDAGGALVVFQAINESQDVTKNNLTDLQKATVALGKLNLELAEAKDKAFASESVRGFRKDLDVLWKNIQIGFYNSLGVITQVLRESVMGLQLAGRNTMDFFNLIPKAFNEITKSIVRDLAAIGAIAVTAGETVKDALSLNVEGAVKGFNSLKFQLTNFSSATLNTLGKASDAMSKINDKNVAAIKAEAAARAAAQAAEDAAEAKRRALANGPTTGATGDAAAKAAADAAKKAEAEAKKAETKRLADLKKAAADQKKEAEALAQKQLELARDTAEQATNIAKGELAEYIRINNEKYKDDKRLSAAKLQDQLDYFDEVAKKQKASNELERAAKELAIKQKIEEIEAKKKLNQTELENVASLKVDISILNTEYAAKDADTEKELASTKKEVNKKYNSDVLEQDKLHRAIQYQEKILDLESNNASEYEIRKAQEDERFGKELEQWAIQNQIKLDLDNDKFISDQEIQIERDALLAQYQSEKDETEQQRVKNQLDGLDFLVAQSAENQRRIEEAKEKAKLSAIANTLGQAAGLFAENTLAYKALAVAQAAINTYLGVSGVLATYPGPIGWAMAAVQIALGLAQVAKIAGIGVKKEAPSAGFAGGGYTGDGGKYEPAGTVHKGEVVWSQADVAAVGGAAAADAMRPTSNGYFNGGVVGVSSIPSVQSVIATASSTIVLDDNSVALIANAIYSGSQAGIGDMADNASIRMGANLG